MSQNVSQFHEENWISSCDMYFWNMTLFTVIISTVESNYLDRILLLLKIIMQNLHFKFYRYGYRLWL